MGALLIFVMGVLMVLRLGAAMATQLEYSGVASELVVIAHEQIDSLEAKTEQNDFKVGANEIEYTKSVTVSLVNPLLYQLDVDVSLKDTLAWGPGYSVTTFSAGAW